MSHAAHVAAQLGGMQPDPTGKVRAQAANVALDLRADDVQRLRAESDLRKSDLAWQQDRDHKRNVMDYLQDDVLTSPARALVWWMAEHPGDIQGAVDRVGQSTRLSSVAQGRGDPSAAGPQLVPSPGARPAEHRDLTATRDLLSASSQSQDSVKSLSLENLPGWPTSWRGDYGRRVRQNFGLTPRVTETAPYRDDREPPGPEDEPPYPDDAESYRIDRSVTGQVVVA